MVLTSIHLFPNAPKWQCCWTRKERITSLECQRKSQWRFLQWRKLEFDSREVWQENRTESDKRCERPTHKDWLWDSVHSATSFTTCLLRPSAHTTDCLLLARYCCPFYVTLCPDFSMFILYYMSNLLVSVYIPRVSFCFWDPSLRMIFVLSWAMYIPGLKIK